MSDGHEGYYGFRRKLALGYLALGALLIGLLVWKTVSNYRSERAAAVSVTAHSARAMAAHVAELIEAVDQPLQSSARAIESLGTLPLTPEIVKPMLAASPLASDSRFWLLFIDAKGRGVVASNGLNVRGVSFAERPYFKIPAAAGTEVFIGAPDIGFVSKRRVFFLSRRVESKSGEFLGVVAAPIVARRVANVFESARVDPSMSIALATQERRIIARAPLFEESFGADISSVVSAFASPLPSSGSFAATSPFQSGLRMFSYAPVGKYPLVVAVGVGRDSLLARLRDDFIAAALSLAAVLIVALLSGRLALRQYWRMELIEAELREVIADLANAKSELAGSERRIRMIADNLPARVSYINADERFMYHNAGDGSGAPLGAQMGKTAREVYGDELYNQLKGDMRKALSGEQICVEQICFVGGEERFFKRQYTPDFGPDGRVAGFYSMVTDITDLKLVQQRLSAIARVDSLTGLPNRAELLDRLDNALARCRRTGASLACLYLDIDRFKEVNDSLGHSGGDAALVEFGSRLSSSVRESDLVARLAGDEFVILLEGLEQPAEAERVASKIITAMAPPFYIEGIERQVTTSVGVVIASPLEDDPRSLLRAADAELYRAKKAGRNRMSCNRGLEA